MWLPSNRRSANSNSSPHEYWTASGATSNAEGVRTHPKRPFLPSTRGTDSENVTVLDSSDSEYSEQKALQRPLQVLRAAGVQKRASAEAHVLSSRTCLVPSVAVLKPFAGVLPAETPAARHGPTGPRLVGQPLRGHASNCTALPHRSRNDSTAFSSPTRTRRTSSSRQLYTSREADAASFGGTKYFVRP